MFKETRQPLDLHRTDVESNTLGRYWLTFANPPILDSKDCLETGESDMSGILSLRCPALLNSKFFCKLDFSGMSYYARSQHLHLESGS